MGVSIGPAAQPGKKSLDAELNLVPFIDLLICCICFLLLTAVWVHLASLRTGPSRSGEGEQLSVTPKARLLVLVGSDGYTVTSGPERVQLPRQGAHYDEAALARTLRDARARGAAPELTVGVEDGIAYRHLVRAMDLALQQQYSEVKVSDSAGLL